MTPLDVLVIDDEKNIRATLRVCLEGLGCKVAEAGSADAAKAAIARHCYDLVFLDLRLEETSGIATLRRKAVVRRPSGRAVKSTSNWTG